MLADSIDEVLARLDEIIATARRERQRFGYFAMLYRNVTAEVKAGIAAGRFENGARMERLDVIFANRYLEAYEQYRNAQQSSLVWQTAFAASANWRPLILQHVLLGINAHINFDLGIAAAETSPGDELPALKNDFNEINNILASMIDEVQRRIGTVSPFLALLDHTGGRSDEAVIKFSLQIARRAAWKAATQLAAANVNERERLIATLDRQANKLANRISQPGRWLSFVALIIRSAETASVDTVLDALAGAET